MRGGGFQGVTAATNSMVRRRSIPRRNSQRLQGTAAVDLKVRRTEPAPRRGRFCRSPETKLEAPPAWKVEHHSLAYIRHLSDNILKPVDPRKAEYLLVPAEMDDRRKEEAYGSGSLPTMVKVGINCKLHQVHIYPDTELGISSSGIQPYSNSIDIASQANAGQTTQTPIASENAWKDVRITRGYVVNVQSEGLEKQKQPMCSPSNLEGQHKRIGLSRLAHEGCSRDEINSQGSINGCHKKKQEECSDLQGTARGNINGQTKRRPLELFPDDWLTSEAGPQGADKEDGMTCEANPQGAGNIEDGMSEEDPQGAGNKEEGMTNWQPVQQTDMVPTANSSYANAATIIKIHTHYYNKVGP
ncbi:hypothetical protein EJB05_50965 [Eragrostis curvula]|uniref:Uncharacterized protein n=1 Tax=Eragrostis curvula TaxID=38414 RepID=A0A5J9SX15_9POAL|nr:hypothetical protein EJB05_50965 [Eragrostis curvula]